jgi:hypothetical protein
MIPIPESAKVVRSKSAEAMLAGKAREWIEGGSRTPGLHASDLLDARMAYWQRKVEKPLSDKLINIFLVGKVLHSFVLGAVDGKVDITVTDDGSMHSEELGIDFSPDALIEGMVRELKTSRSYYEPRDVKDLELYLEQLLVYMVATGTTTSQLWVLYINLKDENGRTCPAFRCFDFSISDHDLAKTKDYLVATAASLQTALDRNDPSGLPLCRRFKCGEGNCQWWEDCRPDGRYGLSPKKWEA